MQIRNYLANHYPALGRGKRLLAATLDSCLPRPSFSQHGEDKLISKLLLPPGSYEIGYIDIGANHPTSISNTYLLYRRGFSGYLIEPNHELSSLNRMFRARDHAVQMGIAPLAAIQKLQVSTTPTISSFSESHFIKRNQTRCRVEPVPTMPLDEAFRSIPGSIGLLNIDVEGMNEDVLVSGLDVLRRSHYACIEHDDDAEAKRIRDILCRANFSHIETLSCNQIFENRKFHRP